VLQYALAEAQGKSGGQSWYDGYAVDPLIKFLKDHRDINIHQRPLPIQTNITIRLSGVVAYMNRSTNVALPAPPDPPSTTTYDYQFKGWTGPEDVLTLCVQYLDKIRLIVADGRKNGFLSL
jgi:hypothetical protein